MRDKIELEIELNIRLVDDFVWTRIVDENDENNVLDINSEDFPERLREVFDDWYDQFMQDHAEVLEITKKDSE